MLENYNVKVYVNPHKAKLSARRGAETGGF